MADGFDALFAALAGDGGTARSGRGLDGKLARLAGAGAAPVPREPGQALSAMLGARAHHAGSHLAVPSAASVGHGRPAYMARSATQAAHALLLALARAEG